jgi:MoxR-like ATPase
VTEYTIDPVVWFAERQVSYPPPHFVTATTTLTPESKQWVLDHLRGRFSITVDYDTFLSLESMGRISFEDPREATIFELKWS